MRQRLRQKNGDGGMKLGRLGPVFLTVLVAGLISSGLFVPAYGAGGSITIEQKGPDPSPGGEASVAGKVRNDDGIKACIEDRKVRVQRMRRDQNGFRTLVTTKTGGAGGYSATFVVKRTRQYRAVAVAAPGCGKQNSEIIKIRVKKDGDASSSDASISRFALAIGRLIAQVRNSLAVSG